MNHYEVLGIDPSASEKEIEAARRIRLRIFHPDRHSGADPEVIATANAETIRINTAYDILRDPARRRSYDRELGRCGSSNEGNTSGAANQDTAAPPDLTAAFEYYLKDQCADDLRDSVSVWLEGYVDLSWLVLGARNLYLVLVSTEQDGSYQSIWHQFSVPITRLSSLQLIDVTPEVAELHLEARGEPNPMIAVGDPGSLDRFAEALFKRYESLTVKLGPRAPSLRWPPLDSTSLNTRHMCTLDGHGNSTTRPFTIPSDSRCWRLQWWGDGHDDNALINLKNSSGDYIWSTSSQGLFRGETYVYEAGQFFIDCNHSGKWRFIVEKAD